MRRSVTLAWAAILALACAAAAPAAERRIVGAGATFPYPLYSKMFDVYYRQEGVKVNYQAIGSGGGIRQVQSRTVDFGATDAFIGDEEMAAFTGAVLHVPTCLGAVVVTYNLPGGPTLNLAPDVVADIFLGKLTRWDDERIVEANPGVGLPDMGIVVVRRSDGSGTTFIFSDYLSKVSPEWKETVGAGKVVNWPCGLGAKGNPGVAGLVKQLPGSIGYVELVYAVSNGMPVANIRNRSGRFIAPTVESVSQAADTELPDDMRVSITDTGAEGGYPISGFTWVIFYKEQDYAGRTLEQARDLIDLVWWMTHEGQKLAEPLHYARLGEVALRKAETLVRSAVYGGEPMLAGEARPASAAEAGR